MVAYPGPRAEESHETEALRARGIGRPVVDQEGQVVSILGRATSGDRLAAAELLPLVYGELKAVASNYLKQERPGHTLQPTALVHEAYIRMAGTDREWAGKSHFLAV